MDYSRLKRTTSIDSCPMAEYLHKSVCTCIQCILQYNTIQYNIKTYNAPYVTKMLFVGAEMTRD